MRILAVSDEECPAFWDHYAPGRLDEYDLILACGDLKPAYLTFLVTMSRARLLYVHGNHDGCYASTPPEGCEDIDGHLVSYNGVRILGLGGCLLYHDGPHQYTDKQMRERIRRLRRAIRKAGGVDIVIAHAPPRGFGDLDDLPHRGFEAFAELIAAFRPKLFLHGHTHLNYSTGLSRTVVCGETQVINVWERYVFDYPAPSDRAAKLIWHTKHKEPDWSFGVFAPMR